MTLLPQVRNQLDAAAHRKASSSLTFSGKPASHGEPTSGVPQSRSRIPLAPRKRASRLPMRAIGPLLLVVCSLAVVAGALVLLHARSRPAREAAGGPSTAAAAPVAQPLLRTLGVLRRAQTKSDLDPDLLKIVTRRAGLRRALGTPDVPLIRLATVTPWGSKVFLVPLKPLTTTEIDKLPPALRQVASRELGHQGNAETLSEIQLTGDGGGGGCCATAGDIEHYGQGSWGGSSSSGPTHAVLVVPDGVERVMLLLPRIVRGGRAYKHSLAVTAPVHNNVAAFQIDRAVDDPFQYMTWYGPTGKIIKRFGDRSAPSAPSGSSPPQRSS